MQQIINTTTGQIYQSITEASRLTGINRNSIAAAVRRGIRCQGCGWQLYDEVIEVEQSQSIQNPIDYINQLMEQSSTNHAIIIKDRLWIDFDSKVTFRYVPDDENNLGIVNDIVASRGAGFKTIVIYQWEWELKQQHVINLIRTQLGLFEQIINARDCWVFPIESSVYTNFTNQYHLHKSVSSSVRFGLFHKDQLVAVIGLGKSRYDKSGYELYRYCVKAGVLVRGGFTKLIKHSGVEHFVSYIDYAHFTGAGYMCSGFTELPSTKPNYVYRKGDQILTRVACQKHRLAKLLSNFDASKSEYENMIADGWTKLYDCGNLKVMY